MKTTQTMTVIFASWQRRAMPLVLLLLMLPLCLVAPAAAAGMEAEVVNFDERVVIKPNGDATMSIIIKLTAKQFIQWKQKYGLNPSLLKREVGKEVSQYATENFQVNQNDMERTIEVSFDARGMIAYKGDGLFEFEVPKEWKSGQRNGNIYEFHYPESMGPDTIAQHTVRVELPAAAYDLNDQLSEQGDKVIQYRMSTGSGGGMWLTLGIALAVCAVGCIAAGFFLKPRQA